MYHRDTRAVTDGHPLAECISSDEAPDARAEDDTAEMILDITAMQERYPSLRNALL